MRPLNIPVAVLKYIDGKISRGEMCKVAKVGYSSLLTTQPEVSIVIPAYNEEANIVPTLASLCENRTNRSVEIIVVDNNSKDKTQELAKACGVTCIFQAEQGITVSRNMGLNFAKGKYILNADADSIYPEDWIELMVKPLDDKSICLTYGRFATVPVGSTSRFVYFLYEHVAEISRAINKIIKDEAVNVYGFNSGFKRKQGLEVDGFNHPPATNEDGWLALKLRNKGFGKLHCVKNVKALVWTTDRRIQIDGGIIKGTFKRIKRTLLRR